MISKVAASLAFLSQANAFAPATLAQGTASRSAVSMKVGVIYSTTTGNTETVAGYVAAEVGGEAVDIADCTPDGLMAFDGLLVGAPTWHTGADEERSGTAWDEFLYGDLTSMALDGKPVAVFGVGDSSGYSDNFCDAMDELKSCFEKQGAKIMGAVPSAGYEFTESKSVSGDNFVGLPCDEDNEPDQSEDRVKAWIAQLKGEGMPI